jgi:hypothetical protein
MRTPAIGGAFGVCFGARGETEEDIAVCLQRFVPLPLWERVLSGEAARRVRGR